MDENKQHLQVLQIQMETLAQLEAVEKFLELQIQMETLAQLEAVEKFLELQQKAGLISELIRKEATDVEV